MNHCQPQYDLQDHCIREERELALTERVIAEGGPVEGDFVIFADGVERRISHVWPDDWSDGGRLPTIQTSDGGSWYLGDGYVSFSGSLHMGVPRESLTLTSELRQGTVWFFHHDWHTANNGVQTEISFRVFTCNLPAPS